MTPAPRAAALAVVLVAAAAVAVDARCPGADWQPFNGSCYWRSSFVAPWRVVADACRLAAPGARPVSVHSQRHNSFLMDLADIDAWLGISRYGRSQNWTWADGSEYDFNAWDNNLSSSSNQCGVINWRGRRTWGGVDCGEDLYFLCQARDSHTTDTPWRYGSWRPRGFTTGQPYRDPWGRTTRSSYRDPWGRTTRSPYRDPWGRTTRSPYRWWRGTTDTWGPSGPPGPTSAPPEYQHWLGGNVSRPLNGSDWRSEFW